MATEAPLSKCDRCGAERKVRLLVGQYRPINLCRDCRSCLTREEIALWTNRREVAHR